MASLSHQLDVALQARSFEPDFHSFKAYAFAERPTAVSNERGLYLGFDLHPNPQWSITGYFDQYYYPANKYQAYFPSRGNEQLLQIQYKIRRGTHVYLRFRADNKEVNAREELPGIQLSRLIPTRRLQGRIHFQTKLSNSLTLRSRLELSSWQRGYSTQPEERSNGFLFYQDVSWKPGFKFRFTGRLALFDAEDYDARIYAYENDILGFFSIPPYYGRGTRMYGIIGLFTLPLYGPLDTLCAHPPARPAAGWRRLLQRRNRRGLPVFGSGLESHAGAARDEIKLQLRLKF
ncbi:MAG: hypothetical protein R3B47_17760 [Bacteroidia bacterium]